MQFTLAHLIPEIDLDKSRQPLTLDSFARELLPPLLCYYATAVLVITPRTFATRLSLLPITLWATFRAATLVDVVAGWPDYERLVYLNQGLLLMSVSIAIRVCIWTFQQKPYRRDKPSSSKYVDALDLVINLRGIGWSWSTGLKLPSETRNTSSKPAFLLSTAKSFLFYLLAFDICHYVVQSFGPQTIASAQGGSIYDPTLHPFMGLLRSFVISGLSGSTVHLSITAAYHLFTIVGVLFGQSPTAWPPLFFNPYIATSILDFWGRWHQLFRHNFIEFGGKPMMFLIGRAGMILGAFFISGVFHYLGLWGMARGSDFTAAAGYFMMQGVGAILELTFRSVVGTRVKGLFGWIWTYVWTVGWGILITEAWSLRGLMGSRFFPDGQRPAVIIAEQLSGLWRSP